MYAELHCHSFFSLLDGASSPEALVAQARALGLAGLALTDHDSLAGAPRLWTAAREAGLPVMFGAEITLADDDVDVNVYDTPDEASPRDLHLTLLAETPAGYANLCRLITHARLAVPAGQAADQWPGKVPPRLGWDALARHAGGLIALTGCRRGPLCAPLLAGQPERAAAAARRLRDLFGPRSLWVELQRHDLPDDDRLARALAALAAELQLPCVATHDAHYATPDRSRLRDALIAIRHNQSLTEARRAGRLPLNSAYALAAPADMARRFAELPQAVRASLEIAERCQVALDFSGWRLPRFDVPGGAGEFACLYQLCHDALPARYPQLTPAVLNQLARELDVIEGAGLAGYFLIVWDLVRFARQRGIRCQGRGSAAGSLVAYLLGISGVDPLRHRLLFERFLSPDRHTIPDIDIDFDADRREEVIQYVYGKYGADHAAMVCNHVTFLARSAVRDLGQALDFPPPVIERLVKSLDTHSPAKAAEALAPPGAGPDEPLSLLAGLLRQIDGCPRHLSIHVGGMLITGPPLDEVVPLERATMPGRVVCQWDKRGVEDAGLIKIDLLGLRTLGMITEALRYIRAPIDVDVDVDIDVDVDVDVDLDLDLDLDLDDPALYAMLQTADTIGTFQVESRAQQQMLPRLKPACFEDIVAEVAILRPGPIQGGAVHPFLRRRAGLEPITYAHPCLEPVLKDTLGVLLFQEQAIQVAMAAAGFKPGEADALRRALTRHNGDQAVWADPAMAALRDRFLSGAAANGIPPGQADAIFQQLAGFAGYGFCKSHAASFALIAYQTLWLKRYHPAAFYCALLNHQPMGFYSPEVVAGDARRHGIRLLPPDIYHSGWDYRVAGADGLRMGLRAVSGLGQAAWERIRAARAGGPFADLRDVCARTRLPRSTVSDLIRAGALDALGERRPLLWALGEIDYRPEELPLAAPPSPVELPELDDDGRMSWEYELLGLSPAGQWMQRYRPALRRAGVLSVAEARAQPNGRRARVAGLPTVRQRPATAKGMVFISLEDETGLIDLVVRPNVYQRQRAVLRGAAVLLADGVVQNANGSASLLLTRADILGE